MSSEKRSLGGVVAIGMMLALCGGAFALWYMFYEVTFGIFGVWRFLGVELAATVLAGLVRVFLGGLRRTTDGEAMTFDPREAPIFLGILVQVAAVAYLYSVFASAPRTATETWVFLGLVVSVNGLGTVLAVANAVVNRNDHVTLASEHLRWRDNAATGEIPYAAVISLEAGKDLEVGVRGEDGTTRTVTVPLSAMNFDAAMVAELEKELRTRVPQCAESTPEAPPIEEVAPAVETPSA